MTQVVLLLWLQFLIVFNVFQYKTLTLGNYRYPAWADVIGWTIVSAPIAAVILGGVAKVLAAPNDLSISQRIRFLLQPSDRWGPAHRLPDMLCDVNDPPLAPQSRDQIADEREARNGTFPMKQFSLKNPSFVMPDI